MKRDLAVFRAVLHSSAADYDHTGHTTTLPGEFFWRSAGNEKEWIYVDLGVESMISEVQVTFGKNAAAKFCIGLSDDAETWTETSDFEGTPLKTSSVLLAAKARYVRILCKTCTGKCYEINKFSVIGENDYSYKLPENPEERDGKLQLTGGAWKLSRAEEKMTGEIISSVLFDDSSWLPATVPGTAFVSFMNAGAVVDPFYDDWQFQASEEYFTADFFYRNRFSVPAEKKDGRVFLNFDSINWKADVFFNGVLLANEISGREHSIEGAFIRARFDVTELVRFGEENFLAVKIIKNETPGLVTTQGLAYGPGPNGGLLGADNPTLHASVGWDWLPTIRGRNIGIIGDVWLQYGGDAEIQDPWIETKLELLNESSAIPMEDRMLKASVTTDGKSGAPSEWHGLEGDSFTVDFGETKPLGTLTFLWGTEAGGAAADLESRHPEEFRVEVSTDGVNYRNLDAYKGGEVAIRFFGLRKAEKNEGRAVLAGHATSDTLPGATAIIPLDMKRFGRGIEDREFVQPDLVRFVKFTVLKQRELNGKKVDTIVRAVRAYEESPEEVEQGRKHSYELDTKKTELVFRTELRNRSASEKKAALTVRVSDGPAFTKEYVLKPLEILPVEETLLLENPKLWWPNGYGEQYLYEASAELSIDGKTGDGKTFKFGVRRFDTPIDGGLLALYCNGVRIVCKGGNWGIDDGLKLDKRQAFDDKVRLHKEANMTMIRNWVGMTSHPGFYDACDKYGVLIWDDFWLANPVDGPEPNDPRMFLENAADKIRAVRSHAALTFYCGRNEGNPRKDIDDGLLELTEKLDGTRIYFPNSASAPVGSGGGYQLGRPGEQGGIRQYFNDISSSVLRSERGIPNVPALESVKRFVKKENLWPISEVWALHDWTYHMNGPANTYMSALQNYLGGDFEVPVDNVQGQAPSEEDPVFRQYKKDIAKMCQEAGKAWTLEGFFDAAQLINYDHHRGLFDALASCYTQGLLMWMSQSSWPSFMWQTYDYFLDTNGGFFGAKAGNQPTRAIFNPVNNRIMLANASAKAYENVNVVKEIFALSGKLLTTETYPVESLPADAYGIDVAPVDFPENGDEFFFLRLTLSDASGKVLGRNFYWHNVKEYQNYKAISTLPKHETSLKVLDTKEENGETVVKLLVKNLLDAPALGVRIRLLTENGAPVLPVFYSNNYLMMMPQEEEVVEARYRTVGGKTSWEIR